jgi:hypothetical protein
MSGVIVFLVGSRMKMRYTVSCAQLLCVLLIFAIVFGYVENRPAWILDNFGPMQSFTLPYDCSYTWKYESFSTNEVKSTADKETGQVVTYAGAVTAEAKQYISFLVPFSEHVIVDATILCM